MSVSRTITRQLENASWIRRMFEEGARLKAEWGEERVFDFTLGNPDLEPPEEVIRTLRSVVQENRPGSHAYMPNAGFPEVRDALAACLAEETGLPYTGRHLLMTVGAAGALNVLLKAVLDPDDEVIVLAPFFAEYTFYVSNHNGRLIVVETDQECMPVASRIAEALTARTKVVLVNSPNNPSGVVYPAGFYRELEEVFTRRGSSALLVSDEPYKALTFAGVRAPEIASLVKRTVIAGSWSKTLALPGERIGYLAISPQVEEADRLFSACCFTNRVLGFVNAPALWQQVVGRCPRAHVNSRFYQEKCETLWKGLTGIGYQAIKPQGGFYVFARTPIPDDIAFLQILKEQGILAVPGAGFGRSGFIRLSVTVPAATIERAMPGFARAFKAVTPGAS
jgi:aspartate aminotransferase